MMEQPSATPTHDTNERVSERVSEFQTRAASLRHSRTHSHTPSRTSTPWYLSHCLFLAILMVRVLRHTSERVIPWWLTFSPLLLACATLLLVKSSEAYITFTHTRANSLTHAHTHSQNSYRVYCALVDHVGYTTTVVLACVYLSTHSLIPTLGVVCGPLMITATLSLAHRMMNLPPLHSRTIGRLFISSLFNCLTHSLMRIVQPLLLVLKMDGYTHVKWSVVAIPLWMMCSGAVVAVVLLLYLSTFFHIHSNASLRVHATTLMLLCATQLLVLAVCSFLSSYW
jgi:hypothetical protein